MGAGRYRGALCYGELALHSSANTAGDPVLVATLAHLTELAICGDIVHTNLKIGQMTTQFACKERPEPTSLPPVLSQAMAAICCDLGWT